MKKKTTIGVLTEEHIKNHLEKVKKIPRPAWMDLPFHCERYPKCKNTKEIHIHL